jgi:hypothetical protein
VASRILTALLDPELVHFGKRVGIFVLENLPLRKINRRKIVWKALFIGVQHASLGFKPQKCQLVFTDKRVDAG